MRGAFEGEAACGLVYQWDVCRTRSEGFARAGPHEIFRAMSEPAENSGVRKLKTKILKILFIVLAVFLCHCETTPSQRDGQRYMLDPEGRNVYQPTP